jgi:hypothetical protein
MACVWRSVRRWAEPQVAKGLAFPSSLIASRQEPALENYTVLGAKASWCQSKSRRRTSITPLTRA